jgi:hypothetical protein
MQTVGGVLKGVDHEIHLRWRHLRSWIERVFTRDGMTELVLLSFTLALCALVLFGLQRSVQGFTMVNPVGSVSFLN